MPLGTGAVHARAAAEGCSGLSMAVTVMCRRMREQPARDRAAAADGVRVVLAGARRVFVRAVAPPERLEPRRRRPAAVRERAWVVRGVRLVVKRRRVLPLLAGREHDGRPARIVRAERGAGAERLRRARTSSLSSHVRRRRRWWWWWWSHRSSQ